MLREYMKRSVTKEFRDFVFAEYPKVKEVFEYRKFFQYLCFSTYFDEDTSNLVISAEEVWKRCIKKSTLDKYDRREWKAVTFFESFKRDVLPAMEWKEYTRPGDNCWTGKARQIVKYGFDAALSAAIQKELDTPCIVDSSGKSTHVDFVTGYSYTDRMQREERQEVYQEYKADKTVFEPTLNATQTKILTYLEAINCGKMIIRKYHQNEALINAEIAKLDSHPRAIAQRVKHSVITCPQIYYKPSEKGHTCRLHASSESLPAIKREVRKAWCKGWWEIDLKASQFAIIASKLQAPLAQALLARRESIWSSFYMHTHGLNAAPPQEIKEVYKKLMYSICYGMAIKSSDPKKEDLTSIATNGGVLTVLEHPILKEILGLRAKWFFRISANKGAYDVWGKFIPLGDRKPNAVAAQVIQSIEMEIISPIFDIAIKYGKGYKFGIVFFQHDGATLTFQDKNEANMTAIHQHLKDAVEKKANGLKIDTILEFTEL